MTASAVRGRPIKTRDKTSRQRVTHLPTYRQGTAHDPVGAPIIAAVDASSAGSDAAKTAARMARELDAPLVFVYVRRGPSAVLGEPYYQRRLDAEMAAARRVLGAAKATARREGVVAESEILEGAPARRLLEFARHRRARLVALGWRRRRLGRSVSRAVIRSADRPVVVAGASAAPAVAAA